MSTRTPTLVAGDPHRWAGDPDAGVECRDCGISPTSVDASLPCPYRPNRPGRGAGPQANGEAARLLEDESPRRPLMLDDIVDMLRAVPLPSNPGVANTWVMSHAPLCHAAADEIERLRDIISNALAALTGNGLSIEEDKRIIEEALTYLEAVPDEQ